MLTVDESLKAGETKTVHAFEATGRLGKAPFRFTGEVTEKFYQACPGAPQQPGSTCDFCGTCIRYEFWVESSDGKRFKTGCDCIHKTGDSGLIKQISQAERDLRDKKNAAARQCKQERENARVQKALNETLAEKKSMMAGMLHPVPRHAADGLTYLDYVNWLITNGYASKAATAIETAKEAV